MDDPLWRCMDNTKPLCREQLELVIQKKKINEIYNWFHDHFVKSSTNEYILRCPIVILQGPTGCGKTSTLRYISNELKIPIKEYSETSDVTAINYELMKSNSEEERSRTSIDRRKALKFEHFVINSLRYNSLYPTEEVNHADSEFESDDEFLEMVPLRKQAPPPITGVIIHIESLLMFARSQRILIQSLHRLLKIIRDISRKLPRRIAIVFETLEGDSETISLPSKVKTNLKITVYKFNPIIRTNMKKLIESLLKNYKHIMIDRETIEQLVNDSDGDIRACVNTLQLICNKSKGITVLNRINYNSLNGHSQNRNHYLGFDPMLQLQISKKQKLVHEKVRQVRLNSSMMRDNTRGLCFFHLLGKIFYQKRLYPERTCKTYRSIERPYAKESSTEYLADMLDSSPNNLISWLHEHYYQFCDLNKAANYLENLSDVDVTSLNSTQSSQFYEFHKTLDQLQTHLAIESTVFSLYEDKSNYHSSSHKRKGNYIIKSSVQNMTPHGELYSFKKPVSMNLPKITEDYRRLLSFCADLDALDPTRVLLDYASYLNQMSVNWDLMSPSMRAKHISSDDKCHVVFDDEALNKILKTLGKLETNLNVDYETQHEKLLQLIEDFEIM